MLILGIGLVAVLLALIGAAGVTYTSAIPALLFLVVGGVYVPYVLLCASDAKAKASDSKQ